MHRMDGQMNEWMERLTVRQDGLTVRQDGLTVRQDGLTVRQDGLTCQSDELSDSWKNIWMKRQKVGQMVGLNADR